MTGLSIVVPCYNEEDCLDALHQRLTTSARDAAGDDYEIVLVNDGSRDRSWPIMQRRPEWLRVANCWRSTANRPLGSLLESTPRPAALRERRDRG